MKTKIKQWIYQTLSSWFMHDRKKRDQPLCDFDRIRQEILPGDVLLIEGRSRVSDVIRQVTQSPWTHAALYIGRLHSIEDPELRALVRQHFKGPEETQLLIESVLGKGTVINDIRFYIDDHIRICRPKGLTRQDAQRVIGYCVKRLGMKYNVRHIWDLFRLLYPWNIFPRRFRSSLFSKQAGPTTRIICSTLLAEAFMSVCFPILAVVKKDENRGILYTPRDPRLYTPSDFDYSPFFEIIKYPIVPISHYASYRDLPWSHDDYPHIACPLPQSTNYDSIVKAEAEIKEKKADKIILKDKICN